MLYHNLKFPRPPKNRPFFYTNFVQTIDGKVAVSEPGYWPIGSGIDHQVLTELRNYADALIHGGNLARQFGEITLKSFKKPYYIITRHPQSLSGHLRGVASIFSNDLRSLVEELNDQGYKYVLVEGGPTLFGSFLKEGLIDEIFLTIAPKIYGSMQNSTKNLVEGIMLPPNKIKLKLISLKNIKDELFLRYSILT